MTTLSDTIKTRFIRAGIEPDFSSDGDEAYFNLVGFIRRGGSQKKVVLTEAQTQRLYSALIADERWRVQLSLAPRGLWNARRVG